MATKVVCDVCGQDLWANNQKAEFKAPQAVWTSLGYDGTFGGTIRNRKKLDICFNCWHKFKDFVAPTTKKKGI